MLLLASNLKTGLYFPDHHLGKVHQCHQEQLLRGLHRLWHAEVHQHHCDRRQTGYEEFLMLDGELIDPDGKVFKNHNKGLTDQRVIDVLGFEEVSIGDYVLAGGEIAAQVLLEGCIRLIPGVLGHPESLLEESFSNNLLEYPHYTRPKIWEDSLGNKYDVPEVLTSGHHSNIKKWRQDKSVEKTKKIRPDLYSKKEQEQD